MKKEVDMLHGSIMGALVRFSLPLVLSGMLQQLYSWADAFIVGNVDGETALAAIGGTNTVSMFLTVTAIGFTSGLSILAAQLYGAGERARISQLLSSFVVLMGGVYTAAAVGGMLGVEGLLRLLETPEDIFSIAVGYLRIYLIGTPFVVTYNVFSAVLRGMGDSRVPFYAVLVSSVSNVLLDLLFVAALGWGARGAAAATVLAQIGMTAFTVAYAWRRRPELRFRFGRGMTDRQMLHDGLWYGLPMGLQNTVRAGGNLLLQNFMNGFGSVTVAAITTAYRIDTLLLMPVNNLGSGVSTFVAQNVGSGDRKRARRGLWAGLAALAGLALVLTATVIRFGGDLIGIFGVSDEAVAIGRQFFRDLGSFYTVYALMLAFKSYLEGTGDVMVPGILSIGALFFRIALSYLLRARFYNRIVALAEGLSWVLMLALMLLRFLLRRGRPAGGAQ